MSLDYHLSEIKDWEKLCWLPHETEEGKVSLNRVTKALTFLTMSIGMNEIKTSNWKEFFIRVASHENIFGPSLFDFDEEEKKPVKRYITQEDVKEHIGLATNASRYTLNEFYKLLKENIQD